MGTQNNKNEIEIDLRGLFSTILNRLTIIILVGILVGGMAFAYTQFFVDPQYVSKTKVYILSRQDPSKEGIDANDLSFASSLAEDYKVLLTSEPILKEVKEGYYSGLEVSFFFSVKDQIVIILDFRVILTLLQLRHSSLVAQKQP